MTRKTVGLAAVLATLSLAAASIVAGLMLPADMQLPIHWGLDGEPDNFADKWIALMLPVGLIGLLSLLFHFLPELEPRREGLERSEGLYLQAWIGVLIMGAVIELVVLSAAFGWGLSVGRLIVGALGAMLVLIGNQLGKSRRMYLVGVRTPWTLASEEVWIRTHRLAGKLMLGVGLMLILAALLPLPPGLLAGITIGAIIAVAAVPTVYSYFAWRRETRAGGSDQASR